MFRSTAAGGFVCSDGIRAWSDVILFGIGFRAGTIGVAETRGSRTRGKP
ncbi:MAG: hypothetical protein ACHQIO_11260 [Nevskiales bacterium]